MNPTEANQKNFENLMFWVTLLLVFIIAIRVPLESDMWWHLRAGKYTLETGKPLLSDLFSFSRQGEVWINHSWLGEVILYWFYKNAGFWGLGFVVALTATATMAILYRIIRGSAIFKAWFVILAAIISSFIWSPRPQIFSQLMFTILLGIVLKYPNQSDNRVLGWLFALFVLWSNLHGGYGLGILLLIFLFAGEFFQTFFLNSHPSREDLQRLKKFFIWMLMAGVGVVINPNGLNTLIIPFKTVGVQVLQTLIDEWASPDFHQLAMQPFVLLLFLVLFSFALTKNKPSGFELFGFIGFGYLALVAKRNFAPFAVFSTLVVANHLPEILTEIGNNLKQLWVDRFGNKNILQTTPPPGIRRAVNFMIVGVLGLTALLKWFYVTHPAIVNAYEAQFFPQRAVAYLKEKGIPPGNMLNSYGWGGYLIWYLPETPVFVDGRTDLFGDEILTEWLRIVNADNHWEELVEKWDLNWFLIEPQLPVVQRLIENGWREYYRDEVSVVIVREQNLSP
jgi:hypothetical protein